MMRAIIFPNAAGMIEAMSLLGLPGPEQHNSHVRLWRWLAFERAREVYEKKWNIYSPRNGDDFGN